MDARYVDIGKIAHVIGQDACKALPGLHAFTGCHPLSAFSGEVKPLKKLLSKKEYQRAFQQLGVNWLRSEDPLMQLKAFVCDMYGAKNGISDVNQCIYSVSCAKKGNDDMIYIHVFIHVKWNPISCLHDKTACIKKKQIYSLEGANGQTKSTGAWTVLISKCRGLKKLNSEGLIPTLRSAFLGSVSSSLYKHCW